MSVFIPEDINDISRVSGNLMCFWTKKKAHLDVLLEEVRMNSVVFDGEKAIDALKGIVQNEKKEQTWVGSAVKADFVQSMKDLSSLFSFLQTKENEIKRVKGDQFYLNLHNAAVLFEKTATSLKFHGILAK